MMCDVINAILGGHFAAFVRFGEGTGVVGTVYRHDVIGQTKEVLQYIDEYGDGARECWLLPYLGNGCGVLEDVDFESKEGNPR